MAVKQVKRKVENLTYPPRDQSTAVSVQYLGTCDFMSEKGGFPEKELREHFNSAHIGISFAEDSFIRLSPDIVLLLGRLLE